MNAITQHFNSIEPGPAQHLGGLTFVPLKAEAKTDISHIKTFDYLATQNLAAASEHQSGAVVTSIDIKNDSEHHLLMLDGEGIVGAKQNRMVQRSVIIAPYTQQPIPVNCVEQGRWRFKAESNFKKAEFLISPRMRDIKGEQLKNKQNADIQSSMWNEISALERKLGATSETDDLDEILKFKQRVPSDEITNFLMQTPCNGFLVFGTGRPFIEIFGSEELCNHFISKSIKTWIADVDEDNHKSPEDAYRSLNCLLRSDWSSDQPIGVEEVYTSDDNSNGRCIFLNNSFVHGYYYLPA